MTFFGAYFLFRTHTVSGVSVHVSDSTSEDDDDKGMYFFIEISRYQFLFDVTKLENLFMTYQSITFYHSATSASGEDQVSGSKPAVDEIIPVYRRDSHEEVYCGSHVYPGKGVYVLKFDNSYSLWRAKTLYYRVYYTK